MAYTREADLVIVGGGPAGAATAITARQRGLRVVLLEREANPSERPGETLHPGVAALFQRLGVSREINAATFIRHEGHWIDLGYAAPQFQRFGADETGVWRGYQIRRSVLHELLLRRTEAVGAEVERGCAALEPVVDRGRVVGIRRRPDGVELRARIVVDASGGVHWLARKLGLAVQAWSCPLHARYGWDVLTRGENGLYPCMVADRQGWSWTAPVEPGRRAWVRLNIRPDCFHHGQADETARPSKSLGQGADVTWRGLSCLHGPGYVITGDAGAVLDPSASHGVLRALMTGMLAAYHAHRVLGTGCDEAQEGQVFSQWTRAWLRRDVDTMRAAYLRSRMNVDVLRLDQDLSNHSDQGRTRSASSSVNR